jgi:hypothetical protein
MVETEKARPKLRDGSRLGKRLAKAVFLWVPVVGTIGLSTAASLVIMGKVDIDSLLMNISRDLSPCQIKGDISYSGEQIYYVPGMAAYDDVMIAMRRGERWFCSEFEARAAGWQRPSGTETNS